MESAITDHNAPSTCVFAALHEPPQNYFSGLNLGHTPQDRQSFYTPSFGNLSLRRSLGPFIVRMPSVVGACEFANTILNHSPQADAKMLQ